MLSVLKMLSNYSSISSSLMIPRRLATLFTLLMTSSCTKLKLMANKAMPNRRYNEHKPIDTSGISFSLWAGTKSPKPVLI